MAGFGCVYIRETDCHNRFDYGESGGISVDELGMAKNDCSQIGYIRFDNHEDCDRGHDFAVANRGWGLF